MHKKIPLMLHGNAPPQSGARKMRPGMRTTPSPKTRDKINKNTKCPGPPRFQTRDFNKNGALYKRQACTRVLLIEIGGNFPGGPPPGQESNAPQKPINTQSPPKGEQSCNQTNTPPAPAPPPRGRPVYPEIVGGGANVIVGRDGVRTLRGARSIPEPL